MNGFFHFFQKKNMKVQRYIEETFRWKNLVSIEMQ